MTKFFIQHDKQLVTIDRHITESSAHFLRRVEFFILALDQGYSVEVSRTMAYAYQNKLQFDVSYPKDFEDRIEKIIKEMK